MWGVSFVFALAYLALTSLCSSLFKVPVVCLVMNLLFLMGLWLLAFIGRLFISVIPGIGGAPSLEEASSPVAYVRFLSPWTYSGDLLHPHFSVLGPSILAHLAFAAVFLATAYLIFRRRDL
jgi:ABC-2 type transport system permease protein